uniref:Peptide-N(4)-(N-acetyl-beta-glucosaminyl)asparagine amidase n=2 Tax=Dendroctonus ponderosae TaxID=77166 RepID=A0AAR5PYV4_DENPD
MTCENLLEKLNGLHRAEVLPLVGLLVELADRILERPDNASLRKVESNQGTGRTLLQSEAGLFALEAMGFEKVGVGQFLRQDADLTKLSRVKEILVKFQKSESNQENPFRLLLEPCAEIDQQCNPPIRPIVLPPVTFHHTQHFFARIERIFHQCLRYESPELLARARQLVPVIELELAAQSRFRVLQKQSKLNQVELPVSIQEMLILELLRWFKEDFFTWVDSPLCENCQGESTFSHMATDPNLNAYTKRVEMHRCSQCHHLSPFPRYEDLNILLETRRGRCGEWANVFTLFCYCMGWDARIVFDETDHVWTEVYSIGQKRWLHCDACENICDQPEIYECGWNKKVSYVLAYSVDEVQDVTWRYSCQHKEAMTRRKYCSEEALIQVLMDLSRRRQECRSAHRRRYLIKRLALELADMLTERKPGDSQGQGRQSGGIAWRLARGEIEGNFSWNIDPIVFKNNVAVLKYCAAEDEYRLFNGPTLERTVKVWAKGCYHIDHVFRKEEKDWKMVYLARTENAPNGRVSWLFTFPPKSPKQLATVTVLINGALYETGNIQVLLSSDDLTENIPIGAKGHLTERFRGRNELKLEATLSGGKGDAAWQHAQLFRQALSSCESPFIITFTFY